MVQIHLFCVTGYTSIGKPVPVPGVSKSDEGVVPLGYVPHKEAIPSFSEQMVPPEKEQYEKSSPPAYTPSKPATRERQKESGDRHHPSLPFEIILVCLSVYFALPTCYFIFNYIFEIFWEVIVFDISYILFILQLICEMNNGSSGTQEV